ncbi:unnamed protein product [Heterobilharzia americana]|nr:unnamed protein product [Heterobilharzia americana]
MLIFSFNSHFLVMFRPSESSSALSNSSHAQASKILVTKRSWQADFIWARFPAKQNGHVTNNLTATVNETEPHTVYIGDTVDSLTFPRSDFVDEPCCSLSTSNTNIPPHFTHPEWAEDVKLTKFLKVHGFRWYQVVIFLISIVSYLADVASDAYLVYTYYVQEDYYWSALTMILMIVPALLMSTFSLTWYFIDYKVRVDPPRSCRTWAFRLLLHGLQLAPLVRSADAIYYGITSRRPGLSRLAAAQYTQLMLYEHADCAMLRMIECFTESAPQLLLQLYVILTQPYSTHKFKISAQSVSCVFSWLSLAWSLTYYQSALRSSRIEKANTRTTGVVLFFFWKFGVLAARLLALSMLAAVVKGFVFTGVLCIHWLLASGWLITRGTTFCSSNSRACGEIAFDFVLGAVYCFDVVNIHEGHSRLWYMYCYIILGAENFLCALLWWLTHSFINTGLCVSLFNIQSTSWVTTFPSYSLPVFVICSFVQE